MAIARGQIREDIEIRGKDAASREILAVSAKLDQMDRKMAEVQRSAVSFNSSMAAASAKLGLVAQGAQTAISFIADIGRAMERGAATADRFDILSESVKGFDDALRQAKDATLNMVPEAELTKSIALFDSFNIPIADIGRAMEAVSATAARTGQDVNFLAQSYTTGLARLSPMILDNLGVSVKLSDATKRASLEFGKMAKQLSQVEIRAGMAAVVLEQLEQKNAKVDLLKQRTTAIKQLSAAWDDFTAKVEEGLAEGVLQFGDPEGRMERLLEQRKRNIQAAVELAQAERDLAREIQLAGGWREWATKKAEEAVWAGERLRILNLENTRALQLQVGVLEDANREFEAWKMEVEGVSTQERILQLKTRELAAAQRDLNKAIREAPDDVERYRAALEALTMAQFAYQAAFGGREGERAVEAGAKAAQLWTDAQARRGRGGGGRRQKKETFEDWLRKQFPPSPGGGLDLAELGGMSIRTQYGEGLADDDAIFADLDREIGGALRGFEELEFEQTGQRVVKFASDLERAADKLMGSSSGMAQAAASFAGAMDAYFDAADNSGRVDAILQGVQGVVAGFIADEASQMYWIGGAEAVRAAVSLASFDYAGAALHAVASGMAFAQAAKGGKGGGGARRAAPVTGAGSATARPVSSGSMKGDGGTTHIHIHAALGAEQEAAARVRREIGGLRGTGMDREPGV